MSVNCYTWRVGRAEVGQGSRDSMQLIIRRSITRICWMEKKKISGIFQSLRKFTSLTNGSTYGSINPFPSFKMRVYTSPPIWFQIWLATCTHPRATVLSTNFVTRLQTVTVNAGCARTNNPSYLWHNLLILDQWVNIIMSSQWSCFHPIRTVFNTFMKKLLSSKLQVGFHQFLHWKL